MVQLSEDLISTGILKRKVYLYKNAPGIFLHGILFVWSVEELLIQVSLSKLYEISFNYFASRWVRQVWVGLMNPCFALWIPVLYYWYLVGHNPLLYRKFKSGWDDYALLYCVHDVDCQFVFPYFSPWYIELHKSPFKLLIILSCSIYVSLV